MPHATARNIGQSVGTFRSPGHCLDAVVRGDVAFVPGPAAGVLSVQETPGLVDIEGAEAAVRASFGARDRWAVQRSSYTRMGVIPILIFQVPLRR
jgi:hypothetical protein